MNLCHEGLAKYSVVLSFTMSQLFRIRVVAALHVDIFVRLTAVTKEIHTQGDLKKPMTQKSFKICLQLKNLELICFWVFFNRIILCETAMFDIMHVMRITAISSTISFSH